MFQFKSFIAVLMCFLITSSSVEAKNKRPEEKTSNMLTYVVSGVLGAATSLLFFIGRNVKKPTEPAIATSRPYNKAVEALDRMASDSFQPEPQCRRTPEKSPIKRVVQAALPVVLPENPTVKKIETLVSVLNKARRAGNTEQEFLNLKTFIEQELSLEIDDEVKCHLKHAAAALKLVTNPGALKLREKIESIAKE